MIEKRILVVDDEASIRELFSQFFRQHGFIVQTAESGEAALEIASKEPAHVFLLDLNLPGMNGLELCRELRHRLPWTIQIAVTGYASIFELVDCREAGFEDYFVKPVNMNDLVEAANQAFKKIERWRSR